MECKIVFYSRARRSHGRNLWFATLTEISACEVVAAGLECKIVFYSQRDIRISLRSCSLAAARGSGLPRGRGVFSALAVHIRIPLRSMLMTRCRAML
jgi:hypothetical protein